MYLALLETDADRSTFEEIYELYKTPMYRAALRVSGNNHALAEDAVSEAFMKIIKDWDNFLKIPRNKWKSWIVIITKNKTIDLLRKEKKSVPLDDDFVSSNRDDNLDILLQYKDDTEYIAKCIAKLDEKYRVPLQLRWYEELSNDEIAKALGIKEGTVRVRIHRAMTLLRESLDRGKLNNE
jgi:RNA polymerase sigma-70 factor (ECF subfamily)